MFETSVIRAQATAAPARRFSLLSVSVIAHTAVAVGAVAMSIATVDFPAVAPDEYSRAPVFAAIQIPPPLGTPNGGAKPQAAQAPPVQKPPRSNETTAPSLIPEEVTPAENATEGVGETESTGGGTEPGPAGQLWGDPNSIGGPLDGGPAVDVPAQPQVEEKIYQPHEVAAPVLVQKVDPGYPQHLMRVGVSATVIVRCIIDKNGNVRDPQVIVPASMAPFNAEVLEVLPRWRYKPATLAGRPVDSYLTVTVHFQVKR